MDERYRMISGRILGFCNRAKLDGYDLTYINALLINPWRNEVRKRLKELEAAAGESGFVRGRDEEIGEYDGSYEREGFVLSRFASADRINSPGSYFMRRLFCLGAHWHFTLKTGWPAPKSGLEYLWKCGFNRPGMTHAKSCTRTTCPFCNLFLSRLPLYSALWDGVTSKIGHKLQTFSLALPPVCRTKACELIDSRGVPQDVLEELEQRIRRQLDDIRSVMHGVATAMTMKKEAYSYAWFAEPEIVVSDRGTEETEKFTPEVTASLEERLERRGQDITDMSLRRISALWRKEAVIRLVIRYAHILQPDVYEGWGQLFTNRILKRFRHDTAWAASRGGHTCVSADSFSSDEDLSTVLTPMVRLNMSWMNGVELYSQLRSITSRSVGGNIPRYDHLLPSLEELKEWQRKRNPESAEPAARPRQKTKWEREDERKLANQLRKDEAGYLQPDMSKQFREPEWEPDAAPAQGWEDPEWEWEWEEGI